MKLRIEIKKVCIGTRTFKCRAVPHSPNRLTNMHWGQKLRWTQAWQDVVKYEAISAKNKTKAKFPIEKAVLTVTLYSREAQDEDNAVASLKPLIDGLRYAKVIADDKRDNLRVKTKSVIVKTIAEEKTVLELVWGPS